MFFADFTEDMPTTIDVIAFRPEMMPLASGVGYQLWADHEREGVLQQKPVVITPRFLTRKNVPCQPQ